MIDATHIYGSIYQGSKPKIGSTVFNSGFGSVVLCAVEYQPAKGMFPGVRRVVHVPLDDADPTQRELAIAMRGAWSVYETASQGIPTLVTCQQGRNRSGLVTALAIHFLTGESGEKIVKLIQSKRRDSLRNPYFVIRILSLPETR